MICPYKLLLIVVIIFSIGYLVIHGCSSTTVKEGIEVLPQNQTWPLYPQNYQ